MRGCGSTHLPVLACMPGPAASSRKRQSKRNRKSCEEPIQTASYLPTLDLDSISSSRDDALEPYWNDHCEANQSIWWLPHRIASRGQGSRSSSTSSNFQEVQSSFWKKTDRPSSSTSEHSLLLSFPTAIPSTEGPVIKGTRETRVYPKNEAYLVELIRQQRKAYNLAIACFKEAARHPELRKSDDMKKTNLRSIIREYVHNEVAGRLCPLDATRPCCRPS